MYDYNNSGNTENTQSSGTDGEYRYSGPFYQDSSIGGGTSYGGTSYSSPEKKQKKKKGWMAGVAKVVCAAMLFGVVASASFQAANYAGKTWFGDKTTAESSADNTVILPKTETVVPSGSSTASGSSASVSSIVDTCMPSLVAITNVSVADVPNIWSMWGYGGSTQQEQTSTGTGIIIGKNDTELLIVTNQHVIANAQSLSVVFSADEGKEEAQAVEAKIKGQDDQKDLGVIAVKLSDIPQNTLDGIKIAAIGDSSALRVGDQVVAIGNALGYGQSVTSGIISAMGRNVTLQNEQGQTITNSLIQTDAAINPGNSGGALLNMKGEVIGINEAKYSSSGVEGMGYAIPISDVEGIISDLSLRTTRDKADEANAGYLGISCQDVTAEISKQFDMPQGVYISGVTEGSAADKAGLKKKDMLVKFDNVNVSSYKDLKDILSYYSAGETVEVVIQRPEGDGYKEMTVEVTLSTKEEAAIQ